MVLAPSEEDVANEGGGDGTVRPTRVLVAAATEGEIDQIRASLREVRTGTVLGRPLVAGRLGILDVLTLATGIGKVNAAMATAVALQTHCADLVVSVGVGGGFAATGGEVGSLAVATSEHYGDEGVETGGGWRGLEEIGIPLLVARGRTYFNALPVDQCCAARLLECAGHIAPARPGAFVTVSTVTGTRNRTEYLEGMFQPLCESMEGAAVAHAALAQGVAFAEVRGISNPVGPRNRSSWQLEEAARVAQRAVLKFLRKPRAWAGTGGAEDEC